MVVGDSRALGGLQAKANAIGGGPHVVVQGVERRKFETNTRGAMVQVSCPAGVPRTRFASATHGVAR